MNNDAAEPSPMWKFAETHSHLLLLAVGILIVVVLVLVAGMRGWTSPSSVVNKFTRKLCLTSDAGAEIDRLIKEINELQKAKLNPSGP